MTLSSLSIGCEVILQPSQQGEWSDGNYRNPKATRSLKTSGDFPKEEKPPADK